MSRFLGAAVGVASSAMAYQPRRNILRPLGKQYTDLDAGIFKKYLHIPRIYLAGIIRRYPRDLNQVPLVLHELIDQCESYQWRMYKMKEQTKEEMIRGVQFRIARVPPMYIDRNELPSTTGANLKVYSQILDNPAGFAKLGRVLYFHSTFEEQSMLAASNIIKAGIRNKLKCMMLPLSTFMEEVKTFEESKPLRSMEEADIAALTMMGTIYTAKSGFSEATMSNFVDQRRVAGKTTILSAHLTPDEFRERYGIDLARFGAIYMRFEDAGIVATVAQLAKELDALKGGS